MTDQSLMGESEMEKLVEHFDALFRHLERLFEVSRTTERRDVREALERVSADFRHLHRERAVQRLFADFARLRTRVEQLEAAATLR